MAYPPQPGPQPQQPPDYQQQPMPYGGQPQAPKKPWIHGVSFWPQKGLDLADPVTRKWVLLLGGGGLIVLLGCGGFVVGIVALVFGVIKDSGAYKMAMADVRTSDEVREAFGGTVEDGWWVGGQINESGGSGNADLQIPVSGPNGDGMAYVSAVKVGSEWQYTSLTVTTPDGTEIDVLAEDPDPLLSDKEHTDDPSDTINEPIVPD